MTIDSEIDELRSSWAGKYVYIGRNLTLSEYEEWLSSPVSEWHEDYTFIRESIIDDFYWKDDGMWLVDADGFSWPLDDRTFICPFNRLIT